MLKKCVRKFVYPWIYNSVYVKTSGEWTHCSGSNDPVQVACCHISSMMLPTPTTADYSKMSSQFKQRRQDKNDSWMCSRIRKLDVHFYASIPQTVQNEHTAGECVCPSVCFLSSTLSQRHLVYESTQNCMTDFRWRSSVNDGPYFTTFTPNWPTSQSTERSNVQEIQGHYCTRPQSRVNRIYNCTV